MYLVLIALLDAEKAVIRQLSLKVQELVSPQN